MDIDILESLREEHPTSSWALWSEGFPEEGCVEEDSEELVAFIERNRGQLRPSIVLLSLNPSTSLPSDFQNFHSTDPTHRNDQFRDVVEDAGLDGAYMTDLVERVVDPDSGNVDPSSEDVENLLEQLDVLGKDRYYLICFHEKVFATLKGEFNAESREYPHNMKGFTITHDGLELACFRVWFHANWGVHKDKVQELREQLNYLNDNVIDEGPNNLERWLD